MPETAGAMATPPEASPAPHESWPAWAFALFCAALPWSIAPMSITLAILLAAGVAAWVKSPTSLRERTPVDLPALGWIAAFVLSAAFALDRGASVARLPKALFPLLVPLAAARARDPRAGRRALGTLLVSAAAAAIFGTIVWIRHGAGIEARARGAVGHYMTFGGQLLLLVSLAAGIALATRSRGWRALALVAALTGTVALAATFTRSAWLGLGVALAALAGILRPRLLPLLVAVAALALWLAPAAFRSRATSAFDPLDRTARERSYMWRAGARMFLDRPLTGVGLEDLKPVYERYRVPEAREPAGHLHSVPVQIAATMGIAGLAAFVALVVGLFRAAAGGLRGAARRGGLAAGVRAGATAALAGFLVAGLFEWNLGDEELLYLLYTLVGIAWAARGWEPDPVPLRAPRAAAPAARAVAAGSRG